MQASGQKLIKYDLEGNSTPIAIYYNPDKSGATSFYFDIVNDKAHPNSILVISGEGFGVDITTTSIPAKVS